MKNSIQNYVMKRLLITFIPPACIILYLLFVLKWQNDEYTNIVKNLSIATEFNFKFKENVDHKMYRVVIGADTIENLNPYEDLEYAKNIFEKLLESGDLKEEINRPKGLITLVNILNNQIDNIAKSDIYKDYNKNILSLEYDIRITTELIEDTVNDYIYEETKKLNTVSIKIRKQMAVIFTFSIISILCILYFTMYMYNLVSGHIADPIKKLCNYTKRSENDLLENNLKSNILEIDELSYNFNDKIIRIKELIENIKIEQKNKKNTELWLLQAQINPHFLYNTLDTVVWMAEAGDSKKVVDMITALSSFLRIGLNKGKKFIQIREEIRHIESYLKIQKFRYDDILEYSIEIEDSLYDMRILKLLLQPLVENALYHGIKYKREGGSIRIRGYEKDNNIILEVIDNGVGMDENKLNKIKAVIENTSLENRDIIRTNGDSFGLYNVAERIRLYYGNEYGLDIESRENVGTTVTIILPAENNID
ncbi:hypothetical protein HMPREF0491_00231 [Lachnospiraceae oral taxon 107 str. F0167]|nr:hypothetical protein HMPREF0491_00231 [Lachnospiraceae oral taxon 107 str. F0167]